MDVHVAIQYIPAPSKVQKFLVVLVFCPFCLFLVVLVDLHFFCPVSTFSAPFFSDHMCTFGTSVDLQQLFPIKIQALLNCPG